MAVPSIIQTYTSYKERELWHQSEDKQKLNKTKTKNKEKYI